MIATFSTNKFYAKEKQENWPSWAYVLDKTLNLVILSCCFEDDSKEMEQNDVKIQAYRAIAFSH